MFDSFNQDTHLHLFTLHKRSVFKPQKVEEEYFSRRERFYKTFKDKHTRRKLLDIFYQPLGERYHLPKGRCRIRLRGKSKHFTNLEMVDVGKLYHQYMGQATFDGNIKPVTEKGDRRKSLGNYWNLWNNR
jgi:hypothetical protein